MRAGAALIAVNAQAALLREGWRASFVRNEGDPMATTGISAIDHAPQVFAEWLNELCADLGWEKARAYLLLCETLHAVRDFLSVDEAADLSAQLPLLVRGVFFDGWDPSRTPARPRNKADFLARVEARFRKEPLEDPERAVSAVFDLLRRHVSWGEFEQVKNAMRKPIRELWE
ncbi:DUF2267 domain-containing protein [Roseibacterium sp. SDUM158017]|uniref:DUF2267 domain-containing protein n=1 Tax=Roseicyclus salinarum TaxID=3036773 RepID=UPI002415556F|nr:DUF2267 domain-containing protein [Roseibacterium sp. SDUM158017]MDG4648445.1 DUF2267 domain-containing protein [Roseibacterium sp. SDUM158017]